MAYFPCNNAKYDASLTFQVGYIWHNSYTATTQKVDLSGFTGKYHYAKVELLSGSGTVTYNGASSSITNTTYDISEKDLIISHVNGYGDNSGVTVRVTFSDNPNV